MNRNKISLRLFLQVFWSTTLWLHAILASTFAAGAVLVVICWEAKLSFETTKVLVLIAFVLLALGILPLSFEPLFFPNRKHPNMRSDSREYSGRELATSVGGIVQLQNLARCVKCGSTLFRQVFPRPQARREMALPTFSAYGFHSCQSCGHTAERRAPAWAWYCGVIVGASLFAPLIWAVVVGSKDPIVNVGSGMLALFGGQRSGGIGED